jgi:hypothetical protein
MKRFWVLATAVVLFVLTIAAGSQQSQSDNLKMDSGADVLMKCGNSKEPTTLSSLNTYTFCLGYLHGWHDAEMVHGMVSQEMRRDMVPICFPDGISLEELKRVVLKYIDDHPTVLHSDAYVVVRSALLDAYPCQEKSKR